MPPKIKGWLFDQLKESLKEIKDFHEGKVALKSRTKKNNDAKFNKLENLIKSGLIEPCSNEENKELTDILDSLTEEDLKEAYSYEVDI